MMTIEELADFRANGTIPESLYKTVDEAIYQAALGAGKVRDIIPVNATNEGLTKQVIQTAVMSGGSAGVGMTIAELGLDMPEISVSTDTIPVLGRSFTIDARNLGKNIDTATVARLTKLTVYEEDSIAIAGSSKYGIAGLYAGAGLTETTSLDFGTAGNAIKKVANAIDALNTAGIYSSKGYNLGLASTQYRQLMGSVVSGVGREAKEVRDMLEGGDIISLPHLSDGTGLLMPVKTALKGLLELYVPFDLQSVLEKGKFGGIDGLVAEAMTPRIIDNKAIVALSGI